MKDAEFISLVNLYLDHEISAPDAQRLEIEVNANPERRKVYHDYCRMQKGCQLLAADFRTGAVTGVASVIPIELIGTVPAGQRGARRQLTTFGLVAAIAACVALVGVNWHRTAPKAAAEVLLARSTEGDRSTAAPIPTSRFSAHLGSPRRESDLLPKTDTFIFDSVIFKNQAGTNGVLSLSGQAIPAGLNWISTVQLSPVPAVRVDDLRFESDPVRLSPEARALGLRHGPAEAADEMSAFRFLK